MDSGLTAGEREAVEADGGPRGDGEAADGAAVPADFCRFETLFDEEFAELRAVARDRDVPLEVVARTYFAMVRGEHPMISHAELQAHLDRPSAEVWNAASVLVDFGEAWRSKATDQTWWWVVASEFLAERCSMRNISLKKYTEMKPDLRPFQDQVANWYWTRQMHGNLQHRTMREIKIEHGRRLQEAYYPDKPLDPDEFQDHHISCYLKTAQDVIVEALDLSY